MNQPNIPPANSTFSLIICPSLTKAFYYTVNSKQLNKGKNAKELARTVVHLLAPFKGCVKSITTDNGTEFACHEMIAKSIGTKVYFADPYSSWQKGAIENVNGLIRQYIPKNTSFSNISHQQINKIMHKINTRPREKLKFSTPRECFYEKIL